MSASGGDANGVDEALRDGGAGASREIAQALDEFARLEVFCGLVTLPDDLRAYLRGRQAEVAHGLASILCRWQSAGFKVTLVSPSAAAGPDENVAVGRTDTTSAAQSDQEACPEGLGEAFVEPLVPAIEGTGGLPAETLPLERPAPAQAPTVGLAVVAPEQPASREALVALQSRLAGGAAVATDPPLALALTDVGRILTALGPPRADDGEIDRLWEAVSHSEQWTAFPRDVQRMLVGLIAARMRHLQDELGVDSVRLNELFSALTAFSARERPGFVYGLTRAHRPSRETWLDDADAYWDEFAALLPANSTPAPNRERLLAKIESLIGEIDRAPAEARSAVRSQAVREVRAALHAGVSARDPGLVRAALPLAEALTGSEFRGLRRAMRDEVSEDDGADAPEAQPIPTDWPWWARTRGRRAVMVGGSPREVNRERLERAFGFASLEWEPAEHRRNGLSVIRDRVIAGKLDMVIILARFVGHDADQIILPACRDRGVDWVHVDHGYGVERIRRAVERFTEPDDSSEAVVPVRGGERSGGGGARAARAVDS